MCKILSKHDQIFKSKFENKYNLCSPDIQNELVNICTDVVKKEIVCHIKKLVFFLSWWMMLGMLINLVIILIFKHNFLINH